jgi:hypothetical protein
MTGISLPVQWPLTYLLHGSVSRREQLFFFVTDQTPRPDSLFFAAKVVIVDHPDVVREVYGTTKALQCVATGDPPPLISWLKEGRPVSPFRKAFHGS